MKGRMLLAIGFVALTASAQQPGVPEPADAVPPPEPAPPKYEVEVILFAHADANPLEELFDHEQGDAVADDPFGTPQPLLDPRALDLLERSRAEAQRNQAAGGDAALPEATPGSADGLAVTEPPRADPFELIDPFGDQRRYPAAGSADGGFRFRLLRPDELKLNNEFRRMERLSAYRTLGHAGWVQEGLDPEHSMPMDLSYLGITNPTGTLRLSVSRFLHLSADLDYEPGRGLPANDGPSAATFGLSELSMGPHYRAHMERDAFRSGDLQYLDHPMFGILVLVTPAPEEVEEVEDDTDVLSPAA